MRGAALPRRGRFETHARAGGRAPSVARRLTWFELITCFQRLKVHVLNMLKIKYQRTKVFIIKLTEELCETSEVHRS